MRCRTSSSGASGVPLPVSKLQLDMQIRMPLRKGRQAGYDIANAEAGRHAHPQEPTKLAALAIAVLCFIERRENRLDASQELTPSLSGHDGARGAREKTHTELRFEVGDEARGLGLR